MKFNGEKMKKVIIAFIAISVIALGAIFAIAQKGDHKGGHKFGKRGHHGGGMMLRGVDLTDAQKAQVKEIMEASRSKVKPLRESMKANRQKLREATENGKFDETQVQALATEQANLSAQMLVERTRVKSQVFGLLTQEQKDKAVQARTEMRERFKGKGRHHRNRDKAVEKPAETTN
jgi:periplasmic protein CpxP/Spy